MKIIPLLYLLGTFQGIFLAFSLAGKTYRAGKFLTALLVLSSGYLLYEYFVHERYLDLYPHLIGVYLPILFLIPPILFQMVRYQVNPKARLCWKHSLFLPFTGCLAIMLPYYLTPAHEKMEVLLNHTEAHSLYPYSRALVISLWSLTLIYVLSAFRLIQKFRSNKNQWLKNYCYLFLGLLLFFALIEFLMSQGPYHHYNIMEGTIAVFSLLVHFIGYSALRETGFMKKGSGKEIPISEETKRRLKLDLLKILEEEKGFTDSSLTSKELCEKLGTNSKYLSVIVKESFNCSITSLINSYRVEEAKRMLADPSYQHLNFLGIAMSVGFNNKNSFTRAFRRHTGETPSSYRSTTI